MWTDIKITMIFLTLLMLTLLSACGEEERVNEAPQIIDSEVTDPGVVVDIEGNIYKTIVIGTQTWLAENLKTTILNDGTPVPQISDVTQWGRLSSPGCCWYSNNESANKATHGALYNWFAVQTGKLAPVGWHIPTREEWAALIDYLGGKQTSGGKMKEAGLVHWKAPNSEATNSSGFSAFGSGARYGFCSGFHGLGERAFFWTATSSDGIQDIARYLHLDFNSGVIADSTEVPGYKVFGYSVRCVKD
ncbi:MAG: fibrobacter succinogenes major paralogous domain-containing protein [Bacteroidota bacterium]